MTYHLPPGERTRELHVYVTCGDEYCGACKALAEIEAWECCGVFAGKRLTYDQKARGFKRLKECRRAEEAATWPE